MMYEEEVEANHWRILRKDAHGRVYELLACVAFNNSQRTERRKRDCERLAELWNATRDMKNPAEEIKRLRELEASMNLGLGHA